MGQDSINSFGVHRIKPLPNGDIWMVLYEKGELSSYEVGYSRLVNDKYKWFNEDFKNYSKELIHSVFKSNDGIIWLGGIEHIFRFDPTLIMFWHS